MRKISWSAVAFGVAIGGGPLPAAAMVCNIVYDRNDQVIYRNTTPPIDLSDGGARARAAMRQRGEYLMVIDTDRCAQLVRTTASSGAASVEDIVAGMRPYLGRSGGTVTSGGVAAGGTGSSARAATPAPASSSRSSGMRAY